MRKNGKTGNRQKKIIQRAVCFLLVFAMVTSDLPVSEISEFISLLCEPYLLARAAGVEENNDRTATTINITSKAELIEYAKGTLTDSEGVLLGYRHDDTLSISFSDISKIEESDDFPGIGIPTAPFSGTIQIGNVNPTNAPYGDFNKLSLNNVSLFNYISTDAKFVNASNEETPLLLKVLDAGDTDTAPLFAKNVTKGNNTNAWNLVVNVKQGNVAYQTGGLISSINDGGNAKITVRYLGSGPVSSSDHAGAICGTMGKNSSLELSVNDQCKDTDGTVVDCENPGDVSTTANDKHAGGLVGFMDNGSTLTINALPQFSTSRTISATNAYAGGLIGKCDGGTVTFSDGATYTDTAANSITGKLGAGGVFGYYGVAAGENISIDSTVKTSGGTIKATSGSAGGLIGVLKNNGDASNPSSMTINGCNFTVTISGSNGSGGVVGQIQANALEDAVTIKNVTVTSTRQNGTYGGIVGNTSQNVYIRIDGTNTLTVTGEAGKSGGLVGEINDSFLDVAGENTISGRIRAGVLYSMSNNSVIRFSGKTDVSGIDNNIGTNNSGNNINNANLIQSRQNSLIYALGSGNDYKKIIDDETGETTVSGWSYYRPDNNTSIFEDVNYWGQVVRLVNNGTPNQTLEDAGVVTFNPTEHTVTLNGIAPIDNTISIANSADFAKVALNVKLNSGTSPKTSGALRTESDIYTSTVLNNQNITLKFTGDVDLSGTGITGFTKDYESTNANRASQSFTGNIEGENHTITLANGEPYGYRGSTDLTDPDNLVDASKWGNTGAVVKHIYSSLFSDIGDRTDRTHTTTVKNLNIDGEMRIFADNSLKIGGIAAQMIGNTELNNVSVTTKFTYYGMGAQTSGVGRFFGMDYDTGVMTADDKTNLKQLSIINCTSGGDMIISGGIHVYGYGLGTFGTISRLLDATYITVDGLNLEGSIQAKNVNSPYGDFYTFGGFIGVVFSKDSSVIKKDQTFELNNLTVDGFNINYASNYNYCGGLLGGIWRGVNVLVNNVEVKNGSKITLGATNKSQKVGGLVTQATGYWRVENLKYTDFTIEQSTASTKTPDTIGLIVGEGWEPASTPYSIDTNRLYLEIANESAFTIDKVTLPDNCTNFDEIVGKTIKGSDLMGNGEGFVSIHTTDNKLSMDSNNQNEYKPQTTLGQTKVNQYTRYYYNLDYLLENANTGGEKFLLWSVYNYAAPNIQSNEKLTEMIKTKNTKNFGDYNTLPEDDVINLDNLSYYPIDILSDVTLENKTITLNNSAMQEAHGTTYSTRAYSQHYLMHAGLFRNVKSDLTVSNMTLCGNVGVYKEKTAASNDYGSGALICGTISGSSNDKTNVSVNELTLSALTVNNFSESNSSKPCALLIRAIGSFNATSISGVSTINYTGDDSSTPQAAFSLIGEANGEQMSVVFNDMRLDGRTGHDSVSDITAQTAMDNAYGTKNSIFSQATLIKTLKYDSTKGSSAIYNYNYAEDWNTDGTAKHNITYGKEISNSIEYDHNNPSTDPNDHQTRYLDMHAKDDTNHYTSPISYNATDVYDFSSGFLPYVESDYSDGTGSINHEIAVNHISVQIEKGCGTYNDPYIIEDGEILSAVAKALSTANFSKGFGLYIDNDYLTSNYDVNFEKWDSDKSGDTNHTRYEFNGSSFVGMKLENGEWIEDSTITDCPTKEQVLAYLAGAYYQIKGTEGNNNTITLPESYVGLGAENSDYAFRGVIVGSSCVSGEKVKVVNESEFPFVKVSNGCVVKDIDVNITAGTITLTNYQIGINAKFDYSSNCKYYGAIIGEIMGGDSVIDGVNVTFGTTENGTEIKIVTVNTSANNYQYTQIVPVGGYVGVVVYGGLIFRNMSEQSIDTIGNLTVNAYKNNGTTISTGAMADTNMAHLYVNPIVGRVLNAYVINETSEYKYTNDTATLKNSTKNYAIPDINANSGEKITFSTTTNTNDTINIPDGQSLFFLSCITQSMAGNADTADGNYNTMYSYGKDNKTVHYAKYSAVGSDIEAESDFTLFATKDSIAYTSLPSVPYLIYQYTEAVNGNYPARAITNINKNYKYLNLSNTAEEYTYHLPECFRGIGLLYSMDGIANNVRYNTMCLYGMNGNGHTIDLNIYFYNNSCAWDNYYRNSDSGNYATLFGVGLFNDLYMNFTNNKTITETNKAAHTDDKILNKTNSIYNFTLTGTVEHKQYDNNAAAANSNVDQYGCTAGLIGNIRYTGAVTGRAYNFWDIHLNNLSVKGESSVGGLFGYLHNTTEYIYINNCDADGLTLETNNGKGVNAKGAGAIVGRMEGGSIRLYVNTLYDEVNDYKVSVKTDNCASCGGLMGYMQAIYVTLRNINIIGSGEKRIGINKTDFSTNSGYIDKGYNVGGAVGYIKSGNVLLDNVNVYGVNIYGSYSGGIVGNMDTSLTLRIYNCGVHGKSDDKVKIDDNATYCIEGYRQSGGIVGYANANIYNTNLVNLKLGSTSYKNDLDRCYVNDYTIRQYQNSNSVGAGGIIACNENNKTRVIVNSKVSNCTIACNGQGENRGMGGIIGLTKGNSVQCYNIAVNNLTFDTTAASDSTTNAVQSPYGLFCGCASNSPVIKLVGYTVQGTNTVNVTFSDKLTTYPRNVEFDLGRSYSDDLDTVIPTSTYDSSSYIIYADYNGACMNTMTQNKQFSDIKLDSVTNVSQTVSTDDNFPYVTSSPFYTLGTSSKFLTGDGVSGSGLACANITEQYNNIDYGAKRYKNITDEDVTVYQKLIENKKLVTNDETLPGIPVIIMDDVTYDYDTAIKAYLRILTNSKYDWKGEDGIYKVSVLCANTDGSAPTTSTTLTYTNGIFDMNTTVFDSNTFGQFSLIDVQFYAPNNTAQTAYHLYIPVITKKLYYYGFKTTVFSGTQYYQSKYTDETGNNGFNGNNAKVLMENYGTPVTEYMRWIYPTETLVSDVLGGGFGLDWHYKKAINIRVNYGGKIPAGSKFVLIDKNKKNKEYYYTVTGNETYDSQNMLTLDFDSFKDAQGNAPTTVDFQQLVTEQLSFTKEQSAENRGTFVEDSTNGTFTVKINGTDTKVRLAVDTDEDNTTFNLLPDNNELHEDYYLTVYSVENPGILYHQLQVTSADPLTPNKTGKISSKGKDLHSAQINLANLFENTVSVTTVEDDDNTNIEMNDMNKDVGVHVTSVIQFNTSDTTTIANLKNILKTNGISVYHSTHVYMNKRSTNDGAEEKVIGDIESIDMITEENTITAYSTYNGYESMDNIKISDPVNTDVSGRAVTNFFEVREMNTESGEKKAIDLTTYLTSGDANVAPTVVVDSWFKINYSHSGVISQFPEREQSDESGNIGTRVSARSSLAYSPSDTTYSSNISEIVSDSANRLYYRYQMTDADLKFNVYQKETDDAEEVDGDIITKANDQLGINIFDTGTDTHSVIRTKGVFDASQLSALENENLKIRWTIELRCKQSGYQEENDLKLLDYLNSIEVKDVNENTLTTLTSSSDNGTMLNDGKKWYYQADISLFAENDNAGLFDIYLDFDVKTGADLQEVNNAFYSNYMIVLTASLCEGTTVIDGTSDDDYLIYTNARLDPSFVNTNT